MEFDVLFLNYGRHGVVVKEPRTGLQVEARDHDEARDEMTRLLTEHARDNYVPPADGPVATIETITI
jgi:predicted DNA repair protein MutK